MLCRWRCPRVYIRTASTRAPQPRSTRSGVALGGWGGCIFVLGLATAANIHGNWVGLRLVVVVVLEAVVFPLGLRLLHLSRGCLCYRLFRLCCLVALIFRPCLFLPFERLLRKLDEGDVGLKLQSRQFSIDPRSFVRVGGPGWAGFGLEAELRI